MASEDSRAWMAGHYARHARRPRKIPEEYAGRSHAWLAGYDDTEIPIKEWTVPEYMKHYNQWGKRR